MSDVLVEAVGLRKHYPPRDRKSSGFTAVDGIDFAVEQGESFGILGPNGAGKSSTMRMIACVAPISGGRLTVLGLDPAREGRRIRGRLGVVPQDDALDRDLSVEENLLTAGASASPPVWSPACFALLEFAQLTDGRRRVGTLWRHAAPAHHRPVAGQRAGDPAPRRTHHRTRPAGPAHPVGPLVSAQAAGRDPHPDHPLHGRGGAALRPARGDGLRSHRGGGFAPRAHQPLQHPGRARAEVRDRGTGHR